VEGCPRSSKISHKYKEEIKLYRRNGTHLAQKFGATKEAT
jgi:hypothetical protein